MAYAALRLHRLDLNTGAHLADVRTRHQMVTGTTVASGRLYAATESRLFELSPADLTITRQWERGLISNSTQLVAADAALVMANWRMATIGLFDIDTGRTRRLRTGLQPLITRFAGEIKVVAGFDGKMWTLDVERARLRNPASIPPVTAVATGEHLWAVLAGPPEGGQGQPPAWFKRGSNHIVRLSGDAWTAHLVGNCSALVCDDANGVLWCTLDRGKTLQAVSQLSGRMLRSFDLGDRRRFVHVDVTANVVFTLERSSVRDAGGNTAKASTLVCYSLASPGS